MAPHSSTLAWKIPWTEEPGRPQSMGSLSRTWLSDFTFIFHFYALEKEMATHSSVLAWRIPGTGEPGWLPSMGSHGVGHDWSDLAAAAAEKFKLRTYPVLCLYWTTNQNINLMKFPLKGFEGGGRKCNYQTSIFFFKDRCVTCWSWIGVWDQEWMTYWIKQEFIPGKWGYWFGLEWRLWRWSPYT